jgi:anhydro-N-acetylmuramic acid kinase
MVNAGVDPGSRAALARPSANPRRVAVGCMCGTSLDGLDAVWIEAEGQGIELRARVLGHAECGLGEVGLGLARAARQEPLTVAELARLGMGLGQLHAQLLASRPDLPAPTLIAVHGQTLYHGRDASFALFDGTALLAAASCSVVSELRLVDRAAGGEGAPITPLADALLLAGPAPRAIYNLGGFCNVTRLPSRGLGLEGIAGLDVAPCNQLLDAAARRFLGQPFDRDGQVAESGPARVDLVLELVARLQPDSAQGAAERRPRSLGTGDEAFGLVERLAAFPVAEALASLSAALGQILAAAAGAAREVCLFGGGVHHRPLVRALERQLAQRPQGVALTLGSPEDPGLTPQAREGAAMAILGLAAADGLAITLPQVTGRGATRHLDGRWWLARSAANDRAGGTR